VIAGDDRADFLALRQRASSIGNASDRSNDEVMRQPPLCRRHRDEATAALAFEGQSVVGAQRQYGVPRVCGGHKTKRTVGLRITCK
jgi:hypothetical protein